MNNMNKTWLLFFTALLFSELSFAGRTINSATVDGSSNTSVAASATISLELKVTTDGNGTNNDWKSTGWLIATESDELICEDHADVTEASTTSQTFNITAPNSDDTYHLYLQAYKNDSCTGSSSTEFELTNAVIVGGGVPELLCSARTNNAVINEIQTQDNFIEIYLKNSADILNWALYVDNTKIATLGLGNCEINGTATTDNTGSGGTNSIFPSGTFITCDYNLTPSSSEVLLVDTNGSFVNGDHVVIDYLGYGTLTPSAVWAVNASCASLYPSHNANNKDIARIPDGTGDLEDNDSKSTKGTTNEILLPTIDHYEIYHDGSGITCLSEDINIKACTNADCSSLASDEITATLNLGPLGQAVSITNGEITPNVTYTTAGTIAISLSNLSISAPVDCYVNNVADANCEMTLADSGFIIDIPTLTACKPNATATIQAVQTDNITNTCGAALLGNQTVNFWSTYISPNSGATDLLINTTPIADSSPGTGISLSFDSDGLATFTVQYDDAGQIQLNAEHTMLSGFFLEGDSTFVSKPVVLTVYTDETNYECISGDASCSLFKKAGGNFDLKVNAACWVDDADTDFTDNPVTPNFELNSIAVLSSVVAPSGDSNGSLDVTSFNFSTTDNGTHTMDQAISEVGVFNFAISPSNYFGESLTTQNSPNIGRFYPDHFLITNSVDGSFENACTGFSYSGQNFSYTNNPELTITAYNAALTPEITQNYTGEFIKLVANNFIITPPTTDALQIGLDNANLVQLTWSRDTDSLTDHTDGRVSFVSGNDIVTYLHEGNSRIDEFLNTVDLEFTSIIDSDGVETQGLPSTLQPNGSSIRFGRLHIANAHGSELTPLPVPIQAEYFNGHNWQLNNADQCTTFTLSPDFQLSNAETNSGSLQAGTATMTIDTGTTSAALTDHNPLANGTATMTFSAPGEDNQGYVDIQSQTSLNNDWLLGDFDNDGIYDDEATGRASFGLFKGSDNIIFRREIY
jgi:MSHA biogenesis protein MshQ